MYKIRVTKHFERRYKLLVKRNSLLESKIRRVFKILRIDPFYKGLYTHKVDALYFGTHYSSSVTRNVRIIWDFSEAMSNEILIFTIGGHEGKQKVYK